MPCKSPKVPLITLYFSRKTGNRWKHMELEDIRQKPSLYNSNRLESQYLFVVTVHMVS